MWRNARFRIPRPRGNGRVSKALSHSRSFAGFGRETIEVAAGSNGNIRLDIFHPNTSPSTLSAPPTVLLYLPSDGSPSSASNDDAAIVSVLRAQLPFSVVQINYRLGSGNRYPQPVHDVAKGFDFVLEHLLPKRGITRAGRPEHVGRVAVCGQFLGGSLAVALALTECRIGRPGVTAAAICNPLVDWPGLDEVDGKHGPPAELLQVRGRLFRKQEDYFDPFASPILFFRSAGRAVPPSPAEAPVSDLEHLAFLEREDFFREQLALSALSKRDSEPATSAKEAQRKASKRFPSASLGLRLPMFHISTGADSALYQQADELAHALRKSHLRQATATDFGRKVLLDDEIDELDEDDRQAELARRAAAESKAKLTVHEGLGAWNASPSGTARVTEAAGWLRSVLSQCRSEAE